MVRVSILVYLIGLLLQAQSVFSQPTYGELYDITFSDSLTAREKLILIKNGLKASKLKPRERSSLRTLEATLLIELGEVGKAARSFRKSYSISMDNENFMDAAASVNNIGAMMLYLGELDSSLNYFERAQGIYQKAGNDSGIARLNHNIGTVNYELGNYDLALKGSLSAIKTLRQLDLIEDVYSCLNNIGLVYLAIGEPMMAKTYHHRALKIAQSNEGIDLDPTILNNLGFASVTQADYDSARYFLYKARSINKSLDSKMHLLHTYVHLADMYAGEGRTDSALHYYYLTVRGRKEQNELNALSSVWNKLANFHFNRNSQDSANHYAILALEASIKASAKREQLRARKTLAFLELDSVAQQNLEQLLNLQDEMFSEERIQAIENAAAEYETEKKEQQLKLANQERQVAQLELKGRNQLIFWASISLLLLIIGAFIFIRLQRAKRKRQEELRRLQAVETAREKERSRISRELHDDITPRLAAAKNKASGSGQLELIDHLSQITLDMRKLTHQLAPVDLKRSLEETITDFLADFDGQNGLDILLKLPENGFPEMNPEMQVSIFRMVQELMNNIYKHAQASNASFIFEIEAQALKISVADDGIGMTSDTLKGLGLLSLEERVNDLNGHIDTPLNQGIGTTVYITIPLPAR